MRSKNILQIFSGISFLFKPTCYSKATVMRFKVFILFKAGCVINTLFMFMCHPMVLKWIHFTVIVFSDIKSYCTANHDISEFLKDLAQV